MPNTDPLPLSIVVAAHRRPKLLTRTLASLARVDSVELIDAVWVIENDSRESSLESIIQPFADQLPLHYRFHPQPNKSEALNSVLDVCAEGLIVFLDDDVRIDAKMITGYAKAKNAYPEGVFFGGLVDIDYEVPPHQDMLPYMTWSTKGWSKGDHDCWLSKNQNFLGCNWAANRRDLLSIGGFDDQFGPGSSTGATGQESNAQRRLVNAGFCGRYLADAKVWHYVTATQMTPDWIADRRGRAGQELGRIIQAKFPGSLQSVTLWTILVALKIRFRFQHGRVNNREFDNRWWNSYRVASFKQIES